MPFNRAERPTAKQVVELQYSRCAVSIFGVQRPRASADGRNAASVTVSVDEIDVADPADALTRAGASSRSTTSCCCHLTYAGPSRRWPPSARTRAENGTANLADDRSARSSSGSARSSSRSSVRQSRLARGHPRSGGSRTASRTSTPLRRSWVAARRRSRTRCSRGAGSPRSGPTSSNCLCGRR